MTDNPYFFAIVGSAAVGALVSSIVSGIAQWRERKSRREELLLAKAMELAHHRYEATEKLAAATPGKIFFVRDHVVMTEQYYQWLKHLMEHDRLPDDPKIERSRKQETPGG